MRISDWSSDVCSSDLSFAWACSAVYPMRLGRSRDGRHGGDLGGTTVSSRATGRPEADGPGPWRPKPRPWSWPRLRPRHLLRSGKREAPDEGSASRPGRPVIAHPPPLRATRVAIRLGLE